MKQKVKISLLGAVCAGLAGCKAAQSDTAGAGLNLWPVLFVLLGLACLALAGLRTYKFIQYKQRIRRNPRRKVPKYPDMLTCCVYGAAAIMFLLALLSGSWSGEKEPVDTRPSADPTVQTTEATQPPVLYAPQKAAGSDPANWGIQWEIFQGSSLLPSYTREAPISFDLSDDYFALPGIATFRGNHYRSLSSYGTADVTEQTLTTAWTVETSTLEGSGWSGSGWTGQPLIVQWDDATKAIMNLYPEKKAKADLVEVIYATLDGNIYFLDLEDGSYTRDPIAIGMAMKGAGSLDPRGYPLMYVGTGDVNSSGDRPRMFIISLIDGSILYQYGHQDAHALRQDHDRWCAFDSSPLVDAQSDTLIWPGENGLLYTIRLNTRYDQAAGTISISPDTPVTTRYNTSRSGEETYWYGYEASANIVENYLYVSENGGMFYCVDLNTMELVWAQDTQDDSNSTPVFQRVSEEEGYIYTAPSLHWTKDEESMGTVSIYKLNALTGQIVWEKPYNDVYTIEDVSGGIQSTPVLGKAGSNIENLVIYTISRFPGEYNGIMVALDTATGNEVWRLDMDWYAWSSPVTVYDNSGKAYIVICDANGTATLVDGATGSVLSSLELGSLVEATPAVFNDMLVVGTRGEQILGVKIQ